MNNRIRDFTLLLDLPYGCNLTIARLYVYVSQSHGIQTSQGVIPNLYTAFDRQHIDAERVYFDSDGDDKRNVSATYAYDVLKQLKGNGTYTVTLRNLDSDQSVFSVDGVMLLVAYEQETGLSSRSWISEGCDVILSEPKRGIFPKDSSTSMSFVGVINTTANPDADLMLVSTGVDRLNTTEHVIKFNNGTWLQCV